MSSSNDSRVLAIGIDAAESTVVRQLIEQGEMPALKSLLAGGQWLRVQSPAAIGSGAVWPTFITGTEPSAHGIYSEWSWRAEAMRLSRNDISSLTPFWKKTAEQNIRIGTFEVPFAPPVGVSEGFEITEWWAHDSAGAGLQAGPAEILSLVKESPTHPLSASRFVNTTPNSQSDLKALNAACIRGVQLRGALARTLIKQTKPQLSLLVFPEIHHASHQMWHTVQPHHPIYNDRKMKVAEPLLQDLYREVDNQIGGLIDSTVSDTTILVFALHGMRPTLGIPTFLGPLLCEHGFSSITNWRSQSWTGRALSLLAETKRRAPEKLKKLYYKLTPATATQKLARPTMLPVYDWANTRAFSLPTDQHGWIRINLVGRETQGSVPLEQYDETCDELKNLLLGLTDDDGRPLIRDVVRTAANAERARTNLLPDLVVHWEDAALAWPLRIKDSKLQVEPVGKKLTGQHASDGFCIYRGRERQAREQLFDDEPGDGHSSSDIVQAKDLGSLITHSLSPMCTNLTPL